MASEYDVLIVGAGLSGLQAAIDLHKAGKSIIILEARDRVGGKTWSKQRSDGKGIQELGAAWLNDSNQSMVWEYCEQFGLHSVVQNIAGAVACEDDDGTCHFFPFGSLPKFDPAEVKNIVSIRDKVEFESLNLDSCSSTRRIEYDNVSFEQWCRDAGAGTKALQTIRLWCRGTLGQEPCEVSALAFLEVCRGGSGVVNLRYDGKHGAQYLRLEEGTQSISLGMSKMLPKNSIRLGHAVNSITQLQGVSTVTTVQGQTFKARNVITSVPGPSYKNIDFQPPLPASKQFYLTNVRYGCFVKFICLFQTPFWRRKGACGLAQSFRGPINHCRDTSVDHLDNFALTCFLAGFTGRKWCGLSTEQRIEAVLKQLSSLFQTNYDQVRAEFLDCITSEWMQDKWAGWGCPFAITPPGIIGSSVKDNGGPEGSIYFVGTELADEWRGYMEGALRSGRHGAKQVLMEDSAGSSHL